MLNKFVLIGPVILALQLTSTNGQAMPDSDKGLYSIINKFMLEFHKELIKEENGNLVYSPIHAWAILYQISEMTVESTKDQLKSALHLKNANVDKDEIRKITQSIAEVSLASASYLDRGRMGLSFFIPDFLVRNNMQGNWNFGEIEVNVVDFGKTQEVVNEMNNWVKNQVNPEMEDFIKTDELKNEILVVMISIIYFFGNWRNQFNTLANQPFHLQDGTSKIVRMMNTKGSYRYGQLPNISAEFVELPFEINDSNDNVSMIIIVPHADSNLGIVEQGLNDVMLSYLLTADYENVNLDLPKFKLDSTIDVRLPHERLNINEMYTDSAKVDDHGSSRSKIAKIIQKTSLQIDEMGTNFNSIAKPFTTKRSRRSAAENIHNIRVDRPFIVLICTKDIILLRATIFDPDTLMSISTNEEIEPKVTENSQSPITQKNEEIESTTEKKIETTVQPQVRTGGLFSRIRERYQKRKTKVLGGFEKIKNGIGSIFS